MTRLCCSPHLCLGHRFSAIALRSAADLVASSGRMGLESFRPLTHWVILTCFKRCLLYSRARFSSGTTSDLLRIRFVSQPAQSTCSPFL